MALKPLNHYSMNNPSTIYDEEALTSLELSARTAGKVNEVIATVNEMEEAVTTVIDVVDQKIADGVASINEKVDETVDKKLSDGTLDAAIAEHTAGLEKRIDELAKLPEGSTTGDAELIDIRTVGRTTFDNAGSAVRAVNDGANKGITSIAEALNNGDTKLVGGETFTAVNQKKFLTANGVADSTSSIYRVSNNIDVVAGEIWYIKAKAVYGNYVYIFMASDGTIVDGVSSINDGNGTTIDTVVTVPVNAVSLYVSWMGATDGSIAYRVTGVALSGEIGGGAAASEQISDIFVNSANAGSFSLDGDMVSASEVLNNYVIVNDGRVTTVNNPTSDPYLVGKYPVKAGELYTVRGASNYGNLIYTVETESGEFVGGVVGGVDAEFKSVESYVKIPSGGVWLYVANHSNIDNPFAGKVTTAKPKSGRDWSKYTWVLCGDSLTEVNSHATKRYFDYIADETGINILRNLAKSGDGYTTEEEFMTQLISAEFEPCDVLTLFGGGNGSDVVGSESEWTSKLSNLFNELRYIPGANGTRCAVISPTPWQNNTPSSNGSMYRLNNALRDMCQKNGIPYLDLFTSSGIDMNDSQHRERYAPDGVHLNDEGHKVIASRIREFLATLLW